MRFLPNQTVLDGGNRYELGQEYDVPEDRARYMVSHGWGSAPDLMQEPGAWSDPVTVVAGPAAAPVMLRPHAAASGQDAELT